jgi:hypothetical protein
MYGSVKRESGTWEEKRLVYFHFPEHNPSWLTDDDSWALADIEDAETLLEVITTVEGALTPRREMRGHTASEPFSLLYSPGWCGMSLLKKYLKLYGHQSWLAPADLSSLPDVAEPGGFNWKRPLRLKERAKKYVHFYDRNSQFPAAATGAELGEGTPVLTTTFNAKLPGVWYVTITQGLDMMGTLLPAIAEVGASQWMYTPSIQALEAAGYTYEIEKGYVWPVHHRTLQEWAKGLYEGRKALRDRYGKNSPQEHLSKMIANRGLGWLDLGEVRKRGRNPEKDLDNRPDFYNMVRSLARYRMVLKLLEVISKVRIYPIMIVADNICYVSDEPDPRKAVPCLMVRETELGGFKHDGTYLLEDVLPFIEQYSPNDVRRYVKQLQKVQVN